MSQNLATAVAKLFVSRTSPGSGGFGYGQYGPQAEQWSAQRHAPNYTAAYLQSVGLAASQAGATTSVGLAPTYTGLCLSNPAASGKNLVLLNVSGSFNVVPAAFTGVGLITGFAAGGITAHTTPATVQSSFIGLANPLVGLVDAACTLVGTPIWSRWLAETPAATTGFAFSSAIDGGIIIPPGGYAAVGTTIASPASAFLGSFVWAEVAP